MSSIITAILKLSVGLLFDKARNSAANKLKDGDLADEKLRGILVKDLTEIKSKLDCLSLKDLDASYSFPKEGVELLDLVLQSDQKASKGHAEDATRGTDDTASGVLNAALSLPQAIEGLKISSDKRFVSAQDCFKASRERATDAFNNKSLSIKDRIMACKLRVAARILELGLEDPEAAITACLLSLVELHGLPAIQEMFTVFLKGGLKSKINKSERLENIMSILFINNALYDFASKYSCKSSCPFTWPKIELKDRPFHPILHTHEILTKVSSSEESITKLNQVILNSKKIHRAECVSVNSRGEILILAEDKITVIYSTGESKEVIFPDTTESNLLEHSGMSIAVDSNDDVYVIRWLKTSEEHADFISKNIKKTLVLYVFDENYNIKSICTLFRDAGDDQYVNIAVDKNQNLIMITSWDDQVYFCNSRGTQKFRFKRDGYWLRSLSISNNDIMIVSDDESAIQTYSRTGTLKCTIKVPEGHRVVQFAYHHRICKTIVLTFVSKQNSWFLLGYSEAGELEDSVLFRKLDSEQYLTDINIKSHPSGPVAILCKNNITYI